MSNLAGRAFSTRGVAVAIAFAMVMSTMSTAAVAQRHRHKVETAKQPHPVPFAKRLANTPGGGSGMPLLEWKIIAMLRP